MFKKFHHLSDSTVAASYGHAIISIQREYYSESDAIELIENEIGNDKVSRLFKSELSSFATHPITFANEKFAHSISIGFPLGVDFTRRHYQNFYSTLSLGRGLEYIFQRKLIHTSHLGLSLGVNYRIATNGFSFRYNPADDAPPSSWDGITGYGSAQTAHSIGLRSTFFLIDKPNSKGDRFFIALVVSNNHFLGIRGQFLSFGINTGFF